MRPKVKTDMYSNNNTSNQDTWSGLVGVNINDAYERLIEHYSSCGCTLYVVCDVH